MDAIDNAEINLSDAKVKVSKTEKDLAAAKEAYETAKQNAATCNRNLAAAKDKLERAGGLSYVDAYENGVADEDFAFLNEYIMLVKQAENESDKAAVALAEAREGYAMAYGAYQQALTEYSSALSDVAICQEDYNGFLALSGTAGNTNTSGTGSADADQMSAVTGISSASGDEAASIDITTSNDISDVKTSDAENAGVYGAIAAGALAAGILAVRKKKTV